MKKLLLIFFMLSGQAFAEGPTLQQTTNFIARRLLIEGHSTLRNDGEVSESKVTNVTLFEFDPCLIAIEIEYKRKYRDGYLEIKKNRLTFPLGEVPTRFLGETAGSNGEVNILFLNNGHGNDIIKWVNIDENGNITRTSYQSTLTIPVNGRNFGERLMRAFEHAHNYCYDDLFSNP